MQEGRFEQWLLDIRGLSHATVGSRLSNCRRLETYEGDLDEHFDRDHLEGLIARLEYSATDERDKVRPRHDVPIDGDFRTVRTVSATLKSSATLYQEFREGRLEGVRRQRPNLRIHARRPPQEPLRKQVQPDIGAPSTFDLGAVIAGGESDQVEFKSSLRMNRHTERQDPKMGTAVIKTIAAFLNTRGGTLIVGVKDDGAPIGIDYDEFDSEDHMSRHLNTLVTDRIEKHIWGSYIDSRFDEYQGKRVLVVRCKRAAEPVFAKEGSDERFYIRNGNRTDHLPPSAVVKYINANFPRR